MSSNSINKQQRSWVNKEIFLTSRCNNVTTSVQEAGSPAVHKRGRGPCFAKQGVTVTRYLKNAATCIQTGLYQTGISYQRG